MFTYACVCIYIRLNILVYSMEFLQPGPCGPADQHHVQKYGWRAFQDSVPRCCRSAHKICIAWPPSHFASPYGYALFADNGTYFRHKIYGIILVYSMEFLQPEPCGPADQHGCQNNGWHALQDSLPRCCGSANKTCRAWQSSNFAPLHGLARVAANGTHFRDQWVDTHADVSAQGHAYDKYRLWRGPAS